jgi:ADP-heptose:LPS heptosyltransferase
MTKFLFRLFKRAARELRALIESPAALGLKLAVGLWRYLGPTWVEQRSLGLVRLDAIGDYVLFRNVLHTVQVSGFATHRITVIGNQAWLPFAQVLDGELVDEWIAIDVTRHSRSPLYRAQLAWRLKARCFEVLVHPTYSPTVWADRLVADLRAVQKVAAEGNSVNRGAGPGRSRIYDRFVEQSRAVLFEAYRNQEFVEHWLGLPVRRSLPQIESTNLESREDLPMAGFVAFHIDASRPEKEWPLDRYQALAQWLVKTTTLAVVLLGTARGGEWSEISADRVVDLRAKTSLASTTYTLSRAAAFVGNDSALLHIALAVGVPGAIGICFGQHYGRFVPYPAGSRSRTEFVFPSSIEARSDDPEYLRRRYDDGSFEDIRTISTERVAQALSRVLALTSESSS